MSRQEWVASILIVYHLTALGVAAVPDSQSVPLLEVVDASADPVSRTLTPLFDESAQALASSRSTLYRLLGPVRPLVNPYLAAGVGDQSWNMFSNPYREDQYLRLDHHVTNGQATTSRVLRELVLPAERENRVRLVYRVRDKFLGNTLVRFKVGLGTLEMAGERTPAQRQAELDQLLERLFHPIARYYRSQLTPHLPYGERVTRIEVWYGIAPIPPPGDTLPASAVADRLARLEPYHDGPAVVDMPSRPRPPGSTEREADIQWTLLYATH
jgi:hypothetical protein